MPDGTALRRQPHGLDDPCVARSDESGPRYLKESPLATIHFALADYSDNTDVVDPLVFQGLNAFDWSNFLFFPVGLGTMLLASGICAIRHGALPKLWQRWLAIVLGITLLTPAFPVGLFVAPFGSSR